MSYGCPSLSTRGVVMHLSDSECIVSFGAAGKTTPPTGGPTVVQPLLTSLLESGSPDGVRVT